MTFEELHNELKKYYGYCVAIQDRITDLYEPPSERGHGYTDMRDALFEIIEHYIDMLDRAENLLEEFSKQSLNVKNLIEGFMLYAENKVSSGGHYNIVEAKAIVNALEVKSSNDYLPRGILKDFESRRSIIRNLITPPIDTSSNTTAFDSFGKLEEEEIIENIDAVNSENLENVNSYFRFTTTYFRNQLVEAINLCGKTQSNYALLEVALEESNRVKTYGQHSIFLTALKEWDLLSLDYDRTQNSVKDKYGKKDKWNTKNKQLLAALKDCFKDRK